ncbi:hypothetical protein M0805_006244 [Coniferiporia weirii]|nr:hypothetical protein M0805_006244 [Coniferiporia weirii]
MTTNILPKDLFFDLVSADEVPAAHAIEVAGFPADEAATLERFYSRQAQAPELFFGAFLPPRSDDSSSFIHRRTLVGYTCATRAAGSTLTHASMSAHDPTGNAICIHAVGVAPALRRRGIARALLRAYVQRLRAAPPPGCDAVLLLCHDELRSLYEQVGFEYAGPSAVVHGTRPWLEMRLVLEDEAGTGAEGRSSQSIPPGVIEAMQASSSEGSRRGRPTARSFADFASVDEVVSPDSSAANARVNKYDLLCPRLGCGSIILKGGVGRLIEKDIIQIEPSEKAPVALLAPLPPVGQAVHCWLVQPTPMAFENIGFSRPVAQASENAKTKLLSCADCDLGPLGWCFEGGREFWLVCTRVGYRM